jgi:hypothetical protein
MYEEAIQFWTDLISSEGSIVELFDCDYTFLNETLANYYGVPDVTGNYWRRVDGVRRFGRGGVLTMAATLAKQSGASRTSPILRGNWISEVLLGERLPRPPKGVPQLSELPPEGVSERELIARHSQDKACAKCHAMIDPLGMALEGYDTIGRRRTLDLVGNPIDTQVELPDGTHLAGVDDLRGYLVTQRRGQMLRQFNRKLLGYALGRSVQLSDEPFLDELFQRQSHLGFRFGDTIVAIVTSRQFLQIRGREKDSQRE